MKKDDAVPSPPWYQDFTRFVQLKGLSERSRLTCYGWVRPLASQFPGSHLLDLPPERVLDFLIHLQDGRKLKANTLNQAVCALRTLYRDHLARDWDIWKKIKSSFGAPSPYPHGKSLTLRSGLEPQER